MGLIPKKALEMSAEYFLRFENFKPELVLENRMADAMASRGGLTDFLDALAAPTATPGGGSASAAAAAMAAALGAMVTKFAKQDSSSFEEDRQFFTEAVDRDSEAFQQVMAAYKRPKAERAPFVEEALHGAAEVPLQVAGARCAMLSAPGSAANTRRSSGPTWRWQRRSPPRPKPAPWRMSGSISIRFKTPVFGRPSKRDWAH